MVGAGRLLLPHPADRPAQRWGLGVRHDRAGRHGLSEPSPLHRGAAAGAGDGGGRGAPTEQLRSEEHTSELQSLMRISYAVFCLKKKNYIKDINRLYKHNKSLYQRLLYLFLVYSR